MCLPAQNSTRAFGDPRPPLTTSAHGTQLPPHLLHCSVSIPCPSRLSSCPPGSLPNFAGGVGSPPHPQCSPADFWEGLTSQGRDHEHSPSSPPAPGTVPTSKAPRSPCGGAPQSGPPCSPQSAHLQQLLQLLHGLLVRHLIMNRLATVLHHGLHDLQAPRWGRLKSLVRAGTPRSGRAHLPTRRQASTGPSGHPAGQESPRYSL